MGTPSRTCNVPGCELEIHRNANNEGLCLRHYLEEVLMRLDAATDRFRLGEGTDREALDWLLGQVDSIVDAVAEDGLDLDEELHSRCLELVLGIANLNEYIRHQCDAFQGRGT